MITQEEIGAEIAKLEAQPASYAVIERLAWLYVVRDHFREEDQRNDGLIPDGCSEFREACRRKSTEQIMALMDEMMDTVQAIHPRLYRAVMERLRG